MRIFHKKVEAFTLIEMLIVMSVFIILIAIGIEAFSGLRTTILTNQTVENFKQNVRWTQRAAVLLKREPGENWLYGIGIDLTDFYTNSSTKEYSIFKWCSTEPEFKDDPRAQNQFPNFIPGTPLADVSGNGQIPSTETTCLSGSPAGLKVIAEDMSQVGIGAVADFVIQEPLQIGYRSSLPDGNPRYVLYESITGNVFYYDVDGYLMNFDSSSYVEKNDPDLILDFVITDLDYKKGINVKINPVSGRVVTESIGESDINNKYSFD